MKLIVPSVIICSFKISKSESSSAENLAFSTDKIHSAYLKLKENNVELIDFSEKLFFCFDPDKNLIEIRQK